MFCPLWRRHDVHGSSARMDSIGLNIPMTMSLTFSRWFNLRFWVPLFFLFIFPTSLGRGPHYLWLVAGRVLHEIIMEYNVLFFTGRHPPGRARCTGSISKAGDGPRAAATWQNVGCPFVQYNIPSCLHTFVFTCRDHLVACSKINKKALNKEMETEEGKI